ncbi:hypothetical protein QBC37DRAFT_21635 [Rhypophila decipiens]|uniref:Uncharacterized protein n=1 Tax=Rhypophila decipiens TaxID=261697 RepID=A0AAN6Y2S0_9PEZI|nr:hypothetical protein QBC37DRAFT_21635 [Rhypophila decipiens]
MKYVHITSFSGGLLLALFSKQKLSITTSGWYSTPIMELERPDMRPNVVRMARNSYPLQSDRTKRENQRQNLNRSRKLEIAIKSLGVLAFLLSCVALWPTIASASDTKLATSLAQWTSVKDFMEFCDSHGFNASDCVLVRNMTLSPPPGFSNPNIRRWAAEAGNMTSDLLRSIQVGRVESSVLTIIKFIYPCLGLLAIMRFVKNRYPRYQRTIVRSLASVSNLVQMKMAAHWKPPFYQNRVTNHQNSTRGQTSLETAFESCQVSEVHTGLLDLMLEADGQSTGARPMWASANAGTRRRRILRHRHTHSSNNKRENSTVDDMDDWSSDELVDGRQSSGYGESRRSRRTRLRRRTGAAGRK